MQPEVVSEIAGRLREVENVEVEVVDGGQPHYEFIISME